MNKQRFVLFLVAIIGMIATFLPWYKVQEVGTISGLSSSGWFTFILFGVVMLLNLRKSMNEDLSMGVSWSASAFGLLATFVVLWRIIDVYFAKEGMFSLGGNMANIMGSQVSIAYGAWIVVFAGICVPLLAFIFRDRKFRRE